MMNGLPVMKRTFITFLTVSEFNINQVVATFASPHEFSLFSCPGEKYEIVEKIKSPYQEMTFRVNPENKDTCFDLENVLQICDNYRPYYHELSVHNAARWLPNGIKRVLWVGGGDSMLLHEFLKYPSVELIVGLEIDQIVTRASFKHFGTQPHFDDDRVEWWFGDATKSLVMLPKEYFGSFDMVVVDLSETVTSLSVTDELNVMDALTLLIKPDGIFVKNEYYFGHFKDIFPHSVMMHWYVYLKLVTEHFFLIFDLINIFIQILLGMIIPLFVPKSWYLGVGILTSWIKIFSLIITSMPF